MPRASASVAAGTTPTPSPGNGPGPSPAAAAPTAPTARPAAAGAPRAAGGRVNGPGPRRGPPASTAPRASPASARTPRIAGVSSSACLVPEGTARSASTSVPPSADHRARPATSVGVAVSRARTSTTDHVTAGSAGAEPLLPAGTVRHQPGHADLVVAPLQLHDQVLVGELLDEALAPFHDGHRLLGGRVEIQVVDVGDAAQPVGVDVHQRHPAAGVHPRDDERRRGDRLTDPESGADALRQRGLPGAERTVEDDEVARPQQGGEGLPERPGVLHPRELLLAVHASVPATAVRSASNPARGAPFGPKRIAADGW